MARQPEAEGVGERVPAGRGVHQRHHPRDRPAAGAGQRHQHQRDGQLERQ